jgi:predicted nucleic acid-binding protein
MSLVFWDTMLFIYWFEDHPKYAGRVRTIFERMEERQDTLVTSAFTVGEALVAPYRKGDQRIVEGMRSMFRPPFVKVLPFTSETAARYAQIRAELKVSPADAIQLACAAEAGVDLFLTNDRALAGKRVPGIQFVAPMDVALF